MKFKINRDHFTSGLQLVSSVVGSRKTMPILQNVLIEARESIIYLTTTNLDLGIKCSVKANVSEEGSVTLPVKDLLRIVREPEIWRFPLNQKSPQNQRLQQGVLFLILLVWIVSNFHPYQN